MDPYPNFPQLSLPLIEECLTREYELQGKFIELPGYIDLNFRLTNNDGRQYVVKIANSKQCHKTLEFENLALALVNGANLDSIATPRVIKNSSGSFITELRLSTKESVKLRVFSYLEGELWAKCDTSDPRYPRSLGEGLAKLDSVLAGYEHPLAKRFLKWDMKNALAVTREYRQYIPEDTNYQLIDSAVSEFENQVSPLFSQLPKQIIHNDANDYNLIVESSSSKVTGIFDFGDMVESFRIAEIAIAAAYAIMKKDDPQSVIHDIVTAYHQHYPLQAVEISVLLSMIKMRLAVSLCSSHFEYAENPENEYLLISQQDAWNSLKQLSEIDGIAFTIKLQHELKLDQSAVSRNNKTIIDYRKSHLSENLSLAYKEPLKIVRGAGAYLYDHRGNRYIDMVNNVCHVGHCHPRVVAAGQQQMALLNTNTRYLHDNIVNLSEKLLSTMPSQLSVCMFVNSGSEANELAIRLARNYTGRHGMVVVDGAYHGNTNACIDISPYKFDGRGGKGAPDWVVKSAVADPYRGVFRGNSEETGAQYANGVGQAIEALAAREHSLCAFICESIQGVGGQVIHPPEYLKQAYQQARQAGGVCIADEVQVGMGRVGTHWWAFQTQDVIPDIVTIGKPLGNGHPLAAVVTTQEIAASFVNGMEYFNTFGGNPVSSAVGTAVFEVIEEEGLQKHAEDIGEYLQSGLRQLQTEFPVIGDVRGLGMFIGAEFVLDKKQLTPAVSQIDYVIERLKQCGILLTTEGPLHNVLKIKPPLAFSYQDADYFLDSMRKILAEQGARID